MELPSYFQTFLSNIEPTVNQKQDASTGHTTLRERLQKDEEYKKYIQDSFLSGSYGRDTAARPIKDVDIIVIANYSEAWKPDTALWHLKNALSSYYKDKLTSQNRSINISLSYVDMDVVPAFKTQNDMLKIPDRTAQTWVLTNPRKHIQLSTAMNEQRNGLYKPLVKALKWWRDNRMGESWKPKSFLLECLIYNYALSHQIESIPKAIEDCTWSLYYKYKTNLDSKSVPYVSDIGGSGNDVAKRWTYEEFEKFVIECRDSWLLANKALKSEDKSESANLWRRLLGDVFPPSL